MLKTLNRVRIYLQVISMADIVTGRGDEIRKLAMLGERDLNRKSIWEWPKECPSNLDIATWRLYMLIISSTNYSI